MDSVFEALFFLAVGFLAIAITVFVLAVSLLGRAIKISIQEQTEAEERAKKETEDEIKNIKSKIEELSTKGRVELDKELKSFEKKQRQQQSKINSIKEN